ncbi:hypothetical protein Cri9333_1862 [Crinalium epipsammum PCC 9333]|uniref:Uncharacterized protein n=1 Tax=Crinalium epipsammum PCC 9333 TaxID=1173022 RepID=K9VXQ9_9CYAN|nr:hypothetical protein [Crinalium epipsammum]AFZ12746.1 hypothetical protein Cri9333_1862 [Crinalium epipsammum PCC 9333]
MVQSIESINKSSIASNPKELDKLEAEFNTNLIKNHQDDERKTPSILDDANLIKKFVKGETKLLANQNLRIDFGSERIELSTRQGVIIGLYTLNTKPASVLIRSGSQYNELFHEVLSENHFILKGKSHHKGFVEYQQYIPPQGYKVNSTTAVLLWRNWWMGERNSHKHEIRMEILIYFKNRWYPISEITSDQGTFYIKTLLGELTLNSGDQAIWISKADKNTHPPKKQNLVQPNSDSDRDINSLDKVNTQQADCTNFQASPTKILPSMQEAHNLKEQSNSDSKLTNFNSPQATQPVNSTASPSSKNSTSPSIDSSSESKVEKYNFKTKENLPIESICDRPREQNSQTLSPAQLEDSLQSLKTKAIQVLEDYIVNGATETITENILDADGQLVQTKSTTITKKCPGWVIETILQKNDLLENYFSN